MRKLFGTVALASAALVLTGTAAQAQPGLTVVTSPNVAKSDFNELDGVAAVSATNAWAVGFARHAQAQCCAPFRAMIEHWNGNAWSIKAAASVPAGDDTRLRAVTAVSPSSAWAVGSMTTPAEVGHSLIEHWNGTTWRVVPGAPLLATGHNFLTGVAAVSASDVWAVGRMFRHPAPVIEHWNGTSWALVPSPTITANNAQDTLGGVVALSHTDVWAVGSVLEGFVTTKTLALRWNGTSWHIVPSANRGSDLLSSAAGTRAGQPLSAVGSTSGGTPTTATLIETSSPLARL